MVNPPEFTSAGYHGLLEGLIGMGYTLGTVERLMRGKTPLPAVGLRHDMDTHVHGASMLSSVEEDLGVRSTWFIPVSLYFNPAYHPNRVALQALYTAGHAIGLHYDLAEYPTREAWARRRLRRERRALQVLLGVPISSLSPHQPSFLRRQDVGVRVAKQLGLAHPHSRSDVMYISDSCRVWRPGVWDVLESARPERVVINTHHEHWQGVDTDRWRYMDTVVRSNVLMDAEHYFYSLLNGWREHETAHAD